MKSALQGNMGIDLQEKMVQLNVNIVQLGIMQKTKEVLFVKNEFLANLRKTKDRKIVLVAKKAGTRIKQANLNVKHVCLANFNQKRGNSNARIVWLEPIHRRKLNFSAMSVN